MMDLAKSAWDGSREDPVYLGLTDYGQGHPSATRSFSQIVTVADLAGWVINGLALAGIGYTIAATFLVGRYAPSPVGPGQAVLPMTVLKPLHGTEPQLLANLDTLLRQDYGAPLQIIFGLRDGDDPAIAVVEALMARYPAANIALVIDPARRGSNNKVSNLINMASRIAHPLVVISDSDVALPPGSLNRLAAATNDPEIGLASCFHIGRGDAGWWSVLGAMDIAYRFMPSVAVACATGLGQPALGPTMALRREVLEAIGGFARFCDVLADDYEMGRAVRALGLHTVVPPLAIIHCCAEETLGTLIRHELRWTRTIYGIDRAGFIGSGVTHCLPLALIGAAMTGGGWFALSAVGAALAARFTLAVRVDRAAGQSSGPKWLLPARDIVSFYVYLTTFFGNRVEWRGARFKVARDGRIAAD
ncbi:bacteriohopanetetrol glucosamine biosynthesis glycosyltransferase HpnI [Novosphingobium sp. Chol11]|uniref:bacteriohopanetetrol glucosamine biosynthesis glycosyltransferase HpnI n=1 Tax=Novosphingobium sp. Chol11 TaxID=1385763 RepID=UPI0025E8CDFD|nr:bacteriohopanetetrol glucosamine biosynthesis glycosyltransferase HpnI [Novosphingobium sp. Chol11]